MKCTFDPVDSIWQTLFGTWPTKVKTVSWRFQLPVPLAHVLFIQAVYSYARETAKNESKGNLLTTGPNWILIHLRMHRSESIEQIALHNSIRWMLSFFKFIFRKSSELPPLPQLWASTAATMLHLPINYRGYRKSKMFAVDCVVVDIDERSERVQMEIRKQDERQSVRVLLLL